MKLAVALALTSAVSVAHAEAAFVEYADDVAPRPATQLFEASCELALDVRGAVVTAELRQRIANPGPDALATALELPLPAGAQVTGFALRGERALIVDATSPTVAGGTPILGVDPAVLQRAAADHYRVVLQPLAADHDAMLETTWVALAQPRAGALRLVLPGRAATGKLTTCRGTLRAAPGPGAKVRAIKVNGTAAGTPRAGFTLGTQDVVIDVELDIAGRQPIAWVQTQPLADGWHASLVTVLGPRIERAAARRVVILVDGSRSMDLVGRHHVVEVIHAIGTALPADTELEAIVFDRTVTRVFGELRPASPANLAAIEAAVARHGASNGSDLVGAFARARDVIAGARGQAMVVVITDGVLGDVDGADLIGALGAKPSTVDVHAIVLDPATTTSPGAAALRAPVNLFGGAYVEVAVDQLDDALTAVDSWLRPAWLELRLGAYAVPAELRAGAGFTQLEIHKGAARFVLTGKGAATFAVPARPAPTAAIGALALAGASPAAFTAIEDPDDAALAKARPVHARALALHPAANATRSFAVLTSKGKVATSRRAMVRGGGRYERVIALPDPDAHYAIATVASAPPAASAIARPTLERLFRDQLQPRAFVCYQRALGRNAKLAGTASFQLRLGRGEVTEVFLTGLGDAALDACLLDAAYQLTPPLPDFRRNADDQTLANYPLTFERRDELPVIVLGDADSSSPIDVDGVVGGPPLRGPTPHDTRTPLGRLRPGRTP